MKAKYLLGAVLCFAVAACVLSLENVIELEHSGTRHRSGTRHSFSVADGGVIKIGGIQRRIPRANWFERTWCNLKMRCGFAPELPVTPRIIIEETEEEEYLVQNSDS